MHNKRKYIPDLQEFMALTASNYAKLMRLLPPNNGTTVTDNILAIEQQPDLSISLQQKSRYTETYELRQAHPTDNRLGRCFIVRLYHDAKVAEVLSGLNDAMLPPVYPYPNSKMKQPDEKIQLNRFLGEWLSFCLQFGQSHSLNKTHLAFLP